MRFILSRREVLKQASGFALVTPFLSLAACEGGAARRGLTKLAGATMGTTYGVIIADTPSGLDRRALKAEIDGILETVNDQMSTYRPHSELSRFNAGASDSWVGVSADTAAVVQEALRVSRLSRGAFDPTIGPLVDLWGFGPKLSRHHAPARERIEEALASTGYGKIAARGSPSALGKDRAGVRIDLSGIGKGFGVDKVAEHLGRANIENYLVEIGGELRGSGLNPHGQPWRIGVEKPIPGARGVARIARLDNAAVATSGEYRNFFESGGSRFSHIMNPRSGMPIAHGLASVTVIAPTTMEADAMSTALMVLGPEAGLRLAEQEKVAAFFIVKDGKRFVEMSTPGFDLYAVG